MVEVFRPLQRIDDQVGERRGQRFVDDLEQPLRKDCLAYRITREDTPKRNGYEDCRIGPLTNDGREDGAQPQQPSFSPYFQLGQYERIQEFADEVGDKGS